MNEKAASLHAIFLSLSFLLPLLLSSRHQARRQPSNRADLFPFFLLLRHLLHNGKGKRKKEKMHFNPKGQESEYMHSGPLSLKSQKTKNRASLLSSMCWQCWPSRQQQQQKGPPKRCTSFWVIREDNIFLYHTHTISKYLISSNSELLLLLM